MKKIGKFSLFGILIYTLTGCSTYTKQSGKMAEAWRVGDALTASALVSNKVAKVEGKKDELIWTLEYGTILFSVGDIERSLKVFDNAEKLVNGYEEKAKTSVSKETASLFTNQANIPYRGRSYDKIMLNTYKALEYMLLSDHEKARVEFNRSLQRQKDAVTENEKRISKVQEKAEQSKAGELEGEDGEKASSYDVDRAQQDIKFSKTVDDQIALVDNRLLSYASYVNPFSVFLDGLYFSHLGQGNSDFERARKSLERVKGMSPGKYISADYAMVEALGAGQPIDPVTYVLFMTGSAPDRDETRIDIPIFLVSDKLSYVGASFPKLVYHDDFIKKIVASTTEGSSYSSELLCSMDAVISQDFKDDWPVVMTKTLLTTAVKAMTAYALEEAASQSGNSWLKYGTKIAMIGYQAGTNIADTRTWRTLPKHFAYIRMPTPHDGQLSLAIGTQQKSIKVIPGKTHIVMVRMVNQTSQPIIKQFTLNEE